MWGKPLVNISPLVYKILEYYNGIRRIIEKIKNIDKYNVNILG